MKQKQTSISSFFVSKEKRTQSEEDELPHSIIDETEGDEESDIDKETEDEPIATE